jgi:hypothetical protein
MSYLVFINGIEQGTIVAESYAIARKLARRAYGVSCDIIG